MNGKTRKVAISRKTLTVLQRFVNEIAGKEKRSVDDAIMLLIGNSELARIERMAARFAIRHIAMGEAHVRLVAETLGLKVAQLDETDQLDPQDVDRVAVEKTMERLQVLAKIVDAKPARDEMQKRELDVLAAVLRGESELFESFDAHDPNHAWDKVKAASGPWMN